MRMTDSKDDELKFGKRIEYLLRSACSEPDHWMWSDCNTAETRQRLIWLTVCHDALSSSEGDFPTRCGEDLLARSAGALQELVGFEEKFEQRHENHAYHGGEAGVEES